MIYDIIKLKMECCREKCGRHLFHQRAEMSSERPHEMTSELNSCSEDRSN